MWTLRSVPSPVRLSGAEGSGTFGRSCGRWASVSKRMGRWPRATRFVSSCAWPRPSSSCTDAARCTGGSARPPSRCQGRASRRRGCGGRARSTPPRSPRGPRATTTPTRSRRCSTSRSRAPGQRRPGRRRSCPRSPCSTRGTTRSRRSSPQPCRRAWPACATSRRCAGTWSSGSTTRRRQSPTRSRGKTSSGPHERSISRACRRRPWQPPPGGRPRHSPTRTSARRSLARARRRCRSVPRASSRPRSPASARGRRLCPDLSPSPAPRRTKRRQRFAHVRPSGARRVRSSQPVARRPWS